MTDIRTLIVDDDFAVARLHANVLRTMPGFELTGSELTASAAMRRLGAGGVDLVLLDLYLPDASGIDLLRRIRADRDLAVDVIMVSAAADPRLIEQAVSLGVSDFLMKPFTHDELRARLAAHAARVTAWRRVHRMGRVTQTHIDAFLGRGSVLSGRDAAKGMHATTRDRVVDVLAGSSTPLTATEVAEAISLSRVSARRYLERLAHDGLVDVQPRYGEAGRPHYEYRLKRSER